MSEEASWPTASLWILSLQTLYHWFPIIQNIQLLMMSSATNSSLAVQFLIRKKNQTCMHKYVSIQECMYTYTWLFPCRVERYKPDDTTRKEKMFIYIIFIDIFSTCGTCGKPPRNHSLWNIYTGKLILTVGNGTQSFTAVFWLHHSSLSLHVWHIIKDKC